MGVLVGNRLIPPSLPRWALEERALQAVAALHLRDMRGSVPRVLPGLPYCCSPTGGCTPSLGVQ